MKTAGSPTLTPPLRQDIAERRGLARDTVRDLAAVAGLVLLVALWLSGPGGLGLDHVLKASLVFGAGAWLVWRGRLAHPHARFGPANRVTLARLGAVALMAALVGEALPRPPLDSMPAAAWWLVVAATFTALLDAVDGWLARRSGLASAFGARFDMETDAAFTLVLCALVIQSGQAGPWILASGLMRYAFVAAALVWPWLSRPLPPSKRRQTVCVVQITTLIACLGPVVSPLLATGLAAISLALLTLSFAIDVRTLARQRPTPPET
ncbi:CDP-alcohol phosphatidyltransferase family protein [Hydrogenophaga sp.]|uniref:CDP-alcohol phosphatidyltransferase family protein n=1 Tax=Hydrogenophaga sp. TaxID=1904254 RepID=UPI00272F8DBC|nr:CDP-alcohol phosphatidyltransferase family protein [Hydrogenophaga sp.]MDP3165050.1 CDP-alcohol phosphatidyltransferase family protein [Hydrogenophaga sp.]